MRQGKLVLEDGSVFEGRCLSDASTVGEVVFNTGMTGYQEVLTDPSYCGQIITMTYPLIGNYGVAALFAQAKRSYARGLIVGELCTEPNNWQAEGTLADYLAAQQIPCLFDVDTRALTRRIRRQGTMKGVLAPADFPLAAVRELLAAPRPTHAVDEVSTKEIYTLDADGPHVVVMDFGIKRNILHSLHQTGCRLTVVPAHTKAQEILALAPDGIFLSNGPGDPKDVPYAVDTVRDLINSNTPIFGICLGHQLLALAFGADTYALKFGHRGANHPVQDLATGRVYITSQNHGYAVREESLAGRGLCITHRAVNDGTVEGMRHVTLPVFSIQYHPEAAPGPHDNMYLFDAFMKLMRRGE